MYQSNKQYASDLFTSIEEEMGDIRKYHKSSSQAFQNPMEDYHKNEEYLKNEDDPMSQDYQKAEETEEKEEETQELEEEDKKYQKTEDEEEETKTKAGDNREQQSQSKNKKIPKKRKSTIEDAILKAQQEIKSID